MTLTWSRRRLSVLDFDLECRPLSWYGGDWVTKEITAIGAQWVGNRRGYCWLLGINEPAEMLEGFRALYEQADMVTGHFIRSFDLPLLQSAYLENGLPLLGPKLSQDTKLDLVKFSGLSKSQENLGALLNLRHPKVGMDQAKWRSANRLEAHGIEQTRKRVMGDVRQHIELRAELLRRGLLTTPKQWNPGTPRTPTYQP